MPLKLTCHKCNYVLYEGDILKSPSDIINKYNGKCPKCNRKLSGFNKDWFSVYPYDEEDKTEAYELKARRERTRQKISERK
jgi:Zn/Cd-binding protein ZinT